MQAVLVSLLAVFTAILVFRVVLFFRNQHAGLSYRYPGSWTDAQIKMFERLRLSIGGCLGIAWLTLLIAAPQLPVGWPFGFEEALLTTGLLLLSNAWLLLLIRCNWENSTLGKCRFQIRSGRTLVDRSAMGNSRHDRMGDDESHPFCFPFRHNSLAVKSARAATAGALSARPI
jgi:hypothetical protein